jgi:hypothetical protein
VKLQLNLHVPLESRANPGEGAVSLAMSGQVREILGPDRVRVGGLVSTTDRAPRVFEGEWLADLVRRPGAQFPWMLADLRPVDGRVGFGSLDENSILFKIACTGDPTRVAVFLAELAKIFRTDAEDGTVTFSLPVRDRTADFVVCATAGELADSEAAHELLLAGADAVLFATDDPSIEAAARAHLARRGRPLDTLVHAVCGPSPLATMKDVARQLLSLVRKPPGH